MRKKKSANGDQRHLMAVTKQWQSDEMSNDDEPTLICHTDHVAFQIGAVKGYESSEIFPSELKKSRKGKNQ